MSSNQPDQFIEVPRSCFTAFKLRYCDAFELEQTTSVTSLGTIPIPWILDRRSFRHTTSDEPDTSHNLNSVMSGAELDSSSSEESSTEEEDGPPALRRRRRRTKTMPHPNVLSSDTIHQVVQERPDIRADPLVLVQAAVLEEDSDDENEREDGRRAQGQARQSRRASMGTLLKSAPNVLGPGTTAKHVRFDERDQSSRSMSRPHHRLATVPPVPVLASSCCFNRSTLSNIKNRISEFQYKQRDGVVLTLVSDAADATAGVTEGIQRYHERRRVRKILKKLGHEPSIRVERLLVLVKRGGSGKERTQEKWREYVVVVQLSPSEDDYAAVLYFYRLNWFHLTSTDTNESIKKKSQTLYGRHIYDLKVILSATNTELQFFSPIDKSFCIRQTLYTGQTDMFNDTADVTNIIMLPHTTASSVKWLGFLKALLEGKPGMLSSALSVQVPLLKMSVLFRNVRLAPDEASKSRPKYLRVKYRKDGYEVPRYSTIDRLFDEVAKKVEKMVSIGKVPSGQEADRFIWKLRNDRNFLGLAFRIYDRLEWVVGAPELDVIPLWASLNTSLELELRQYEHDSYHVGYSRKRPLSTDTSQTLYPQLVEPWAVEGFLIRLTNRSGATISALGRMRFKIEYYYSVGSLLFFEQFYNAVPLFDKNAHRALSSSGDVKDIEQLEKCITGRKSIFDHHPFERQGSHVRWFKPGISAAELESRDSEALYEAERRACLVANAKGVINLCDVRDVVPVSSKSLPIPIKTATFLVWGVSKAEAVVDESQEGCFELKMVDGSRVRLLASSRSVRDMWMSRIEQLAQFWIRKKQENIQRRVQLRGQNLQSTNMGCEENESPIVASEVRHPWQLANAVTDASLYTISAHSLDQPVLLCGYLYQKRAKNTFFEKVFAVLTPGFLILFNVFERHKLSGQAKPTSFYRHWVTIGLRGCYIYCDPRSDLDLQGHYSRFDTPSPGDHSLPRAYKDGWRSSEDQPARYFTVWFGSTAEDSSNGADQRNADAYDCYKVNNKGTKVTENVRGGVLKAGWRFGLGATHLTFLARSRVRRDLWVTRIQAEIDRVV